MKKAGLSRKERILSSIEFKNVYQKKRATKSDLIWLYKTPNGLGYNRIGLSVANKYCTNIVERNRIKKIFRQIFQRNKDVFGQGVDIVMVLKSKPEKVNFQSFKTIIIDLIKK